MPAIRFFSVTQKDASGRRITQLPPNELIQGNGEYRSANQVEQGLKSGNHHKGNVENNVLALINLPGSGHTTPASHPQSFPATVNGSMFAHKFFTGKNH